MPGVIFIGPLTKSSISYMIMTSVVGIVLGLIMLLYPGGTMTLMKAGFTIFQVLLSIFILYYTISEAVHAFRSQHLWSAVAYAVIGIVFTVLIWILNVSLIYYVVAFFLLVTGFAEIIGSFRMPVGRFFLILLGIIDIMVGVIILKYPVMLALLIAWYVLFWGVSRLFLALDLRKSIA